MGGARLWCVLLYHSVSASLATSRWKRFSCWGSLCTAQARREARPGSRDVRPVPALAAAPVWRDRGRKTGGHEEGLGNIFLAFTLSDIFCQLVGARCVKCECLRFFSRLCQSKVGTTYILHPALLRGLYITQPPLSRGTSWAPSPAPEGAKERDQEAEEESLFRWAGAPL